MQIPAVALATLGAAPDPKQTAKLVKASSDFEALLIGQMMRSARESSAPDDTGEDEGGEGNSSLMELSESQFSQALANSGGLGIGKMVGAGLTKYANR
jgi:Rod binding domain-containing protein